MALIRYAGNRLVATNNEAKPTTNFGADEEGTTFLDTEADTLWLWDGSGWTQINTVSGASESFAIAMAVAL